MVRKILSWGLIFAFYVSPILETRAETATRLAASPQPTLKEQALAIPPGTTVEVKLIKQGKVRGQIGEFTDEGFTVQTAKGNKIEKKSVSFEQVKSIKAVQGNGSATRTWLLIGGLCAALAVVIHLGRNTKTGPIYVH